MGYVSELVKAVTSSIAGLRITLLNLFRPTTTIMYPEERPTLPEGYRGIPVLLSEPDGGELKCIACELCAKACPVQCIEIETHRGEDRKKVLDVYNLDATWCMYCGICVEVCPADALAMSDQFELAGDDVEALLYDKERLAEIGRRQTTATTNFGIKTAPAAEKP
ncbi:MAG TPA: NADH-quinone oxidoreductase subunit I [Limnochordia bacterium]|nr:NADH-quinone oxidoreductase subunit I [Limnochordia bacterium]